MCLGALISDGKGTALCLWTALQNVTCRLEMVRKSVQSFRKQYEEQEEEQEEEEKQQQQQEQEQEEKEEQEQ